MEPNKGNNISEYIERAKKAQRAFETAGQKETDAAVKAIAKAIFDNAE